MRLRPFFAKLIEEPERRIASMDKTGIGREILSSWTDMHGHALGVEQGTAWHRLLNESLAAFAQRLLPLSLRGSLWVPLRAHAASDARSDASSSCKLAVATQILVSAPP